MGRLGEVTILLALFVLFWTMHGTRAHYDDYDYEDYDEDDRYDYDEDEDVEEEEDYEEEDADTSAEPERGEPPTASLQNQ